MANWSDLPTELLEKIVNNLTLFTDHVRFRAVCTSWRAIPLTISLLQRFPWLLALYPDHRHHFFTPSSEAKLYTLNIPRHSRTTDRIIGSSLGYLIIIKPTRSIITLLNPFTGSRISLPPLQIPNCSTTCQGKLIKTDSSDPGFSVVISLQSNLTPPSFFCCRPQDSVWSKIDYDGYNAQARIFLLRLTCGTPVIAPTDPRYEFRRGIPSVNYFSRTYLVASSTGELLKVVRDNSWTKDQRFLRVFRFNKRRWVDVKSIGDDVLFVDFYNAMCLAACDFAGCEGNHIYFCDLDGVCLFDIGDGRAKPLPSNWDCFPQGGIGGGAWVVPSL